MTGQRGLKATLQRASDRLTVVTESIHAEDEHGQKRKFVFFGTTGSCKSTSVNYYANIPLKFKSEHVIISIVIHNYQEVKLGSCPLEMWIGIEALNTRFDQMENGADDINDDISLEDIHESVKNHFTSASCLDSVRSGRITRYHCVAGHCDVRAMVVLRPTPGQLPPFIFAGTDNENDILWVDVIKSLAPSIFNEIVEEWTSIDIAQIAEGLEGIDGPQLQIEAYRTAVRGINRRSQATWGALFRRLSNVAIWVGVPGAIAGGVAALAVPVLALPAIEAGLVAGGLYRFVLNPPPQLLPEADLPAVDE